MAGQLYLMVFYKKQIKPIVRLSVFCIAKANDWFLFKVICSSCKEKDSNRGVCSLTRYIMNFVCRYLAYMIYMIYINCNVYLLVSYCNSV